MIDLHGTENDNHPRKGPTMTAPKNGPERDIRAPKTNKAGRYRQLSEYIGFVRRSIRALAKRVGDEADIEGLGPMLELHRQMETAIQDSVDALRAAGYSWDEIGKRAGVTRQTAFENWAPTGRKRRRQAGAA